MNKRIISLFLLTVVMMTFLTSCKKKVECDFCNHYTFCETKEVWGEEVHICDDCQKQLDDMFK